MRDRDANAACAFGRVTSAGDGFALFRCWEAIGRIAPRLRRRTARCMAPPYMRVLALLFCGILAGCGAAPAPAGSDPGDPTPTHPGVDPDAGPGDPTDVPPPDAGAPKATRAIQILVEPDGRSGKQLVDAIGAAKKSVHVTMYMLTSSDVIGALVARKKAGVDVRVVLNQNMAQGAQNQAAYTQLQQAGVAVRWAPAGFTLTHEKCVIVDGQSAWIMTMNAAYTAPDQNREYLAIDTDPSDVAEAEAIFAGDFSGAPPLSVTGSLVVAPLNASASLLELIGTAKTSLDIESEELSDYRFSDALKVAIGRGVKVRVVVPDNAPTPAAQQAFAAIKAAGGSIVQVHTPYIHAKAIVADGKLAYVGSENLTLASLKYNRELGVIFDAPTEVAKVASTIAADFAKGTAL